MKILLQTSSHRNQSLLFRQLPLNSKFRRIFTTHPDEKVDFAFFLHHSSVRKPFRIGLPRERIAYVSMEPSESHCGVSPGFLSQFGIVVTADTQCEHEHVIYENIHTWWAGLDVLVQHGRHVISSEADKDYSYFKGLDILPVNRNTLSVISSSKDILPGHQFRSNIISRIRCRSDLVNATIWGYNGIPFSDKVSALRSSPFHLSIENTVLPGYWTEKLADPLLCGTRPIYIGDPFIANKFPPLSVATISPHLDPDLIVENISKIIQYPDLYFEPHALLSAKRLILSKYNVFSRLYDIANSVINENSSGSLAPSNQLTSIIRPNIFYSKGRIYFLVKSLSEFLR